MLLRKVCEVKKTLGRAITHEPVNAEVEQARKELFMAWHDFDNAAPTFIDQAIKKLLLAENKFVTLIAEKDHMRDNIFDADVNSLQCSMYRTLSVSKVMELASAQ